MRERIANASESTLDGGITSGATSLDVVDASSFPTAGTFPIKVNNEILTVTAVSGNTFTVIRGAESTTAAAHASGDKVSHIATQRAIRRFARDWTNPFFDIPAAKPMQLLDASGNALTASSFTNVNFTNASKADTGDGSIYITHDAQISTNDYAIIKKSAPSAPWVLTVGFIPNLLTDSVVGDFVSAGPVVRDSSTGEFYSHQVSTNASGVWQVTAKFASPTSSSTSFLPNRDWWFGRVVWFKIEDDNTDLIFYVGTDGINFVETGREARTTFLTPDEIGFAVNNIANPNDTCAATIVAWDES